MQRNPLCRCPAYPFPHRTGGGFCGVDSPYYCDECGRPAQLVELSETCTSEAWGAIQRSTVHRAESKCCGAAVTHRSEF